MNFDRPPQHQPSGSRSRALVTMVIVALTLVGGLGMAPWPTSGSTAGADGTTTTTHWEATTTTTDDGWWYRRPPTTIHYSDSVRLRQPDVVAVGNDHSCALLGTGAVRCWGRNAVGQLGDGTTTSSATPVSVGGPGADKLGDGATTSTGKPVTVVGFAGARARSLAAGGDHTCVVTAPDSALWCWGRNTSGQLGDGATVRRTLPVRVDLPGQVQVVATGLHHTCAVTSADESGRPRLFCWGGNGAGQLGVGDTANRLRPVDVTPPDSAGAVTAVVAMAAGTCLQMQEWEPDSTRTGCVGSNSGTWGFNGSAGSTRLVVADTLGWGDASGGMHRCQVGTSRGWMFERGALTCTGYNANGGVGDGSRTARTSLTAVGTGYSSVSTGWWNSTCAAHHATARYHCWGRGADGQLGNGSTTGRTEPVVVVGVVAPDHGSGVSVGRTHACAIDEPPGQLKGVMCWGTNTFGQLGGHTPGPIIAVPVPVVGL